MQTHPNAFSRCLIGKRSACKQWAILSMRGYIVATYNALI